MLCCSNSVVGSPNEWAVVCSALEAVRSAAKARNAKLVVVVVGSTAELPEERVGAISRIGAIDKRSEKLSSTSHLLKSEPLLQDMSVAWMQLRHGACSCFKMYWLTGQDRLGNVQQPGSIAACSKA